MDTHRRALPVDNRERGRPEVLIVGTTPPPPPTSTRGMTQLFWRPPGALSHGGLVICSGDHLHRPHSCLPHPWPGWMRPPGLAVALIGPRVSTGVEGRGWPGASWLLC